ncbi:glycosyltransferase family 4 protein [Haloarcula sp. S1CR25-12]|uniref:Glycosyltransferase family 4 protein n=1 Tax=Haloarcula saliterrae TaxID=2950534 RepID=A0ABU2FHY5_9EURY|nr:glycosyltransferase family 4 protein [Haloarcula sp. S1CR25-12]MDS0261445.1 glycosyltransferase family 4 protein [Haloarcula sp. S1CR25-12]
MKILHTPVRFFPYIGGVEAYVHDLSTQLVDRGHEVTVVCADVQEETDNHEWIDGIEVKRLRSIGQIANTNITPSLPGVLLKEARAADVIHTHLPTPWFADWSALAGAITDTPVVVTYHNDIIGEDLADYVARIYNQSMLKATLGLSDSVVVTQPEYVSNSAHLDDQMEKIDMIPNGVDTEHYTPVDLSDAERERLGLDPDRPTLFFLSVLDGHHEYKGLTDLLDAMAHLDDGEGRTPQLLVGGGGDAQSRYEAYADEAGVASSVTFLGRVPEEDITSYYSGADLFVLPSTSSDQEGFGLVLLEALACGTPVVTTDVVGIADEVRSEPIGTVTPIADPEALASSIEAQLDGDEFEPAVARALCEDEYSWQASAVEMEKLYRRVVTDPAVPSPSGAVNRS